MATKTEVRLTRGVRLPAERGESGKVVHSGDVVTDASELDAATLKMMAGKGYVAGMEPPAEDAGEEAAPKTSAKKSGGKK